jgi:1-acyl-sn-glycerol-3-phosphate acyltransferase
MQNIIVEKPYDFVRPYPGTWWSRLIGWLRIHAYILNRTEGVEDHETRGLDRLRKSIAAGHGVLLTPNHPRTSDPLSIGWITVETPCHVWSMASWHLFHEGWLKAWAIRRMGGFSINREGVDRQAINTAIELLAQAQRPLVIFPEGATSRINDRLQALLDGVAFIARAAAKKRSRQTPAGKVVVHPVGIKYLYSGDIHRAADDVLTDIEHRLTWQPHRDLSLPARIAKVGSALLSLKEIEYLGQPQSGSLGERLARMTDRLLGPIEAEWLGKAGEGHVVPRVRVLRSRILPDMVAGAVDAHERQRRWRQLADIYLAQQLSCYPPDYLEKPTAERILEIVEKFEEDLTDKARRHGKLKVVIEIGEAIEVSPERDRKAEVDPLMLQIQQALQEMIDRLGREAHPFEP